MTKEELAAELNGIEYSVRIPREIVARACDCGLVIVYGASDDLIEFDGAMDDEAGAWEGSTHLVDSQGLLPVRENINDDDELESFFNRRKTAKTIKAHWDKDGYSWTYETDIPHATFEVMDEGEKYCRGIVFAISDLG
jgi:hypothetical protein